MTLRNCNFETWANNHDFNHKDKIYRELYPYHVFELIEFSSELINVEQSIEFNNITYYAELLKIELQANGKYRTMFQLNTIPKTKTQNWKKRRWYENFQIIYSQNYEFITVYTKNEDSSKDYLKRFFKGNFEKLHTARSLPISDLLLRTLVLNISDELFGNGDHYSKYEILKDGIIENKEYKQFKNKRKSYAPLFSVGRDIWVCHSFNEEKAHREGFYIGKQAKRIIVVFCNPTYTRHHRCKYKNVEVLSLFEFAFRNSKQIFKNYDKQIRLLQNHLTEVASQTPEELLNEILIPQKEEYEIYKSELMEALGIMKIVPKNSSDLFLYLSSMNLLNAWLTRQRKNKVKNKLFKDMYFFKSYLSNAISELVKGSNYGSRIYLEKSLVMVELNGFQFSFHHVPMDEALNEYLHSEDNVEIPWSGKRLQPIAPLVFRYARERNTEGY